MLSSNTRKSITGMNGHQCKMLPMKKKENHLMPFIIVVINCFRFLLLILLCICMLWAYTKHQRFDELNAHYNGEYMAKRAEIENTTLHVLCIYTKTKFIKPLDENSKPFSLPNPFFSLLLSCIASIRSGWKKKN